jgi:hypothetical protein
MTQRLTRRKAGPAERRDVAHGYVMPQAACPALRTTDAADPPAM